jgi:hypothetical protein
VPSWSDEVHSQQTRIIYKEHHGQLITYY